MHSPKSKGEELKGTDTRPTFRFAPHTDRIVPDSAPSTASDAGREPALSPKLNIHPVIPVRTDSISHETGSTGTVDQTSSATHAKKTLKPVLVSSMISAAILACMSSQTNMALHRQCGHWMITRNEHMVRPPTVPAAQSRRASTQPERHLRATR